ncbi:MAG: GNAT family N-acetyltransferase [Roseiarcus sp.]|jgi:CelD/BcsL family acetyltransferase involved in cellulose biosynthesis
MSLASASARSPTPRRAPPGAAIRPAPPFARVEICEALEDARLSWMALAQEATASPYQSFDFARVWFATVGAAEGATPLIVVARDEAGQPVALLPFARAAYGPLRFAVFLGGKDSNFNLGLFRSGGAWSRDDLAALLAAAVKRARPRLDAFLLCNQPLSWRGIANPFADGKLQPSPSFAYASALPGDFSVWLDARASKDAKKKMRKKRARLEAMAPLVHSRAAGQQEINRALAAFHAERRARTVALGVPDPYALPAAQAFLAELARDGALELHTLSHGDRVIAVFGALPGAARQSGLFIGHDGDPEIARSSPGEIMVQAVVADAIARGFAEFDLGVGEARYKGEACEIVEPLFDSAFAFTLKGRLAAWTFLAVRRAKRSVKHSPRLKALHARLRRLRGRSGD